MYAVIRVRGQPDVNKDIEYTMSLLGLNKVNHCVIVPEDDVMRGMLRKAKDYITWGEISETTFANMIRSRGRMKGDLTINDAYLESHTDFKTFEEMAKGIINGECKISNIIKPVFRLHPPIKGYEGNKRSYKNGGALGYRGENINNLISRML